MAADTRAFDFDEFDPHPSMETRTKNAVPSAPVPILDTQRTQPMLIGVCGNGAGAGKDTVANMLVQMLGGTRRAFADAVRECAEIFTGCTPEQTSTREGKETYLPDWGMTVGRMLQRIGTDAVRDGLHPDAWVMAAMRRLPPGRVVFSDVRFPNEAEAIRLRGGVIVRVVRTPLPSLRDGRDRTHASETALDPFLVEHPPDFTITNDGIPLEHLCLRTGSVAQQLCEEDDGADVVLTIAQMIHDIAQMRRESQS